MRFGTGYHKQNGSRRVREVQWRLTELGYHTGPIDGLYGPLTRSAVQWFQIKHGLRPTGVVAATTLLTLRDPKALTRPPSQALAKAPRTQTPAAPQPHPAPLESNDNLGWLVAPLIALLATLLVLGLLALVRRRMRARAFERELEMPDMPPRVPLSVTGGASYRELGVPVLGYVAVEETAALTHESAIESACDDRGWTLTRLVRDSQPAPGGPLDRPGLSYALEQLEEGHAERLVVDRLDHVARSVAELSSVLGWFSSTGVALTALDVGLDTGTPEGRAAARTLLRVGEVEQTRAETRKQSGLRVVPGQSRAAVTDPKLADEIRQMRARGMTLQAIADALNDEGVPAVLGVARWRASSVRAVLGYKHPRAEQW